MKMKIAMSILFAASIAFAQAPQPQRIVIDSRARTAPPLEVFRANEVAFLAEFRSDGQPDSLGVDDAPFMRWFAAGNATNAGASVATIINATNGVVHFTFSPASLNHTAGRYLYEVGILGASGARTYKQGDFRIISSPIGADVPDQVWQNAPINWPLYTYVGTATSGPVRVGAGFDYVTNPDGSITISSLAGAPPFAQITGDPYDNPALSNALASISALAEWSEIMNIPAAITNFAVAMDQGVATTNTPAFSDVILQGTGVLARLTDKLGATDAAWLTAQAQASGAVQRTGDTMTGTLVAPTTTVQAVRAKTTDLSGISIIDQSDRVVARLGVGTENNFIGIDAGGSSPNLIQSVGIGHGALVASSGSNVSAFGSYAGNFSTIAGIPITMIDARSALPVSSSHGGTNDAVVVYDGYVFLGRGLTTTPPLALGGTLRGPWNTTHPITVEGTNISAAVASLSNKVGNPNQTPHLLTWATNVQVSPSNSIQAITAGTGPMTVQWPDGLTDFDQAISLTIPPVGTNVVTLATNKVSYVYGDGLVAPSTNTHTRLWWSSAYGTTNATVSVWKDAP